MSSPVITMDIPPANQGEEELVACHECDFLHIREPVPEKGKALCVRCGAFLYGNIPNSLDRALALNTTAFLLFILANIFPFLSLKASGRVEENTFISGALALYRMGMPDLGVLVLLTSFLFPLVAIGGMLYILLPLKFGRRPSHLAPVYRLVRSITPWSLIGVFMLGVLISIVKLRDLATVIPGVSLYCFTALLIAWAAADAQLDPSILWPRMRSRTRAEPSAAMASEQNLLNCHTCALLIPESEAGAHGHGPCPRCGTPLHRRKANSITRTWALIAAAAILFIPANVYPVMTVIQFGRGEPSTILSGVVHLIEADMWGLAMIIFFASIVVPVLKLGVLSFLLVSIDKKSSWRLRDRTFLYRVTEAVGAWSMVDIYVVALLAGLVNFGALSTIRPGIGATFFGAVVVITMFAAHSFDPRLIWDEGGK